MPVVAEPSLPGGGYEDFLAEMPRLVSAARGEIDQASDDCHAARSPRKLSTARIMATIFSTGVRAWML